MNKIILIVAMCLLAGCASTSALNQTNARLEENIKRIDQNFMVVKKALDNQSAANLKTDNDLRKLVEDYGMLLVVYQDKIVSEKPEAVL